MQRLVFYMNRAGDDCPNKAVLNKVKKLLSESILDKDFDARLATLDDVLKGAHHSIINDDIKSLAKWVASQRWSKKKGHYITTPSYLKKQRLVSLIFLIAHGAGYGASGTCGYIKFTSGNKFYLYCPAGENHFSLVIIDCTGDDIKLSYEIIEKNAAKEYHEQYVGTWPGKLNDYLIETIYENS